MELHSFRYKVELPSVVEPKDLDMTEVFGITLLSKWSLLKLDYGVLTNIYIFITFIGLANGCTTYLVFFF